MFILSIVVAISSAFFITNSLDLISEFVVIEEAEACTNGEYFDVKSNSCKASSEIGSTKEVEGELKTNIMSILNVIVTVLLMFAIINIIYSALQLTMKGVNTQISEEAKRRLLLTFIAVVFLISLMSIFRLVEYIVMY